MRCLKRSVTVSFCAAILCTLTFFLRAQETDDTQRFVYIAGMIEIGSDTALATAALAIPIASSLAAELEKAGFSTLVADPMAASFDDFASLARAALAKGADVLLVGFYTVRKGTGGQVLSIGVRAYDLLADRYAAGIVLDGEAGVAAFATVDLVTAAIGERMRTSLPPLTPREIVVRNEKTLVVRREIAGELGTPVTVRLECPMDGIEVWASSERLGTIAAGILDLDAKAGTTLLLTLKKDGYFDETVELQVVEGMAPVGIEAPYKHSDLEYSLGIGGTTVYETAGTRGMIAVEGGVSWYFWRDWMSANATLGAETNASPSADAFAIVLTPSLGAYILGTGDGLFRIRMRLGVPVTTGLVPALRLSVGGTATVSFVANLRETTMALQIGYSVSSSMIADDTVGSGFFGFTFTFR